MSAMQHLISPCCPVCNVSLFRPTRPKAEDIVFCSICGAGGLHKEVVKDGKPLTSGFMTRAEIEDMLRELGVPRE